MSAIKEMFLKVQSFFEAPVVPPAAPVAPAAAATTPVATPFKLNDGTDITIGIDDPATSMTPDAGDMVTIAGAPAAAGDYVLEDGTTLTVDATGVITVVVAPQPATQPQFTEPPAKTLEERIAAIEAKISAPSIPTGYAQQSAIDEFKMKSEKQDKVIEGLFELIEKLVEEPTAEPATLTGRKKQKFEAQTAKEKRLANLAEAFSKRKTQFQQQ